MDFLDMTLFIALLVCTSPIYLFTQDDVIELNAPSTYKNSNGNYKHLKYLKEVLHLLPNN